MFWTGTIISFLRSGFPKYRSSVQFLQYDILGLPWGCSGPSVCFLRGLAVSAFLWCMIVSFFIRHGFKEVSSDRSHNVLDLN